MYPNLLPNSVNGTVCAGFRNVTDAAQSTTLWVMTWLGRPTTRLNTSSVGGVVSESDVAIGEDLLRSGSGVFRRSGAMRTQHKAHFNTSFKHCWCIFSYRKSSWKHLFFIFLTLRYENQPNFWPVYCFVLIRLSRLSFS